MPRILNVQRKRVIMKKRQNVMFRVYIICYVYECIYITLTSPSADGTSARRRLFGDVVCQQNTRNRVHATNIGAKGPRIRVIFTVKSSRFQRF
jgi:hypothetical protein